MYQGHGGVAPERLSAGGKTPAAAPRERSRRIEQLRTDVKPEVSGGAILVELFAQVMTQHLQGVVCARHTDAAGKGREELALQSNVQYSTVQYSTVQYSTVQYSTVQYSTVQYSTVQYSTVQYSTVEYSTVEHTQKL